MYANLREFVEFLRKRGELVEISAPVDPKLEIAEIADRCVKSATGGPALLFTNVRGSKLPLLINALATRGRMAAALGVSDLDELGDKIRSLLKMLQPGGSKLGMLFELKDLAAIFPRKSSSKAMRST